MPESTTAEELDLSGLGISPRIAAELKLSAEELEELRAWHGRSWCRRRPRSGRP